MKSDATGPVGSEAEMREMIESGDEIAFGPAGEPLRLTMQRVGDRYVVKSGDGRQSYSVATWDEAEAAALKVVGSDW